MPLTDFRELSAANLCRIAPFVRDSGEHRASVKLVPVV